MNYEGVMLRNAMRTTVTISLTYLFCAKVIAKVLLFFEIKKCFFSCFFLQICKYRVFNRLHTVC